MREMLPFVFGFATALCMAAPLLLRLMVQVRRLSA